MTEQLKHLINGGKLKTGSGTVIVEIEGIEIQYEDGTFGTYDIDTINDFHIYISPEDAEIKALKLKVKNLELKLEEITNPRKSKSSSNSHTKSHVHLNKNEIIEIEQMFTAKPLSDIDLIASTYNVTRNVIIRIQRGKHTKSTNSYKANILATNQG